MALPNFFIIGAPKSGTTSLWRYLNQHPQIFMSSLKEPYFFVSDDEKAKRLAIGMNPVMSIAEYERLFATANGAIARGEASVPYLYQPESPALIHELIPQAKLIALLRNPVDRAFSNYWFLRKLGLEREETFEDAILSELAGEREDELSIFLHIRKGLYTSQLRRYLDVFPADQLRIYLDEDLSSTPEKVMKELWQFLGVDESFVANTKERFNTTFAGPPSLLSMSKGTVKYVVKYMTGAKRRIASSSSLQKNNVAPKSMKRATRRKLLRIVQPDVLALQDLLQRDLSHWLRFYE
jgi:hypothetical protein